MQRYHSQLENHHTINGHAKIMAIKKGPCEGPFLKDFDAFLLCIYS